MNQDRAALLLQDFAPMASVLVAVTRQHDLRAQAAHRIDFDLGSRLGHDDRGGNAQPARGECHALGVVAGADGDDSTGTLVLAEVSNAVVCSA